MKLLISTILITISTSLSLGTAKAEDPAVYGPSLPPTSSDMQITNNTFTTTEFDFAVNGLAASIPETSECVRADGGIDLPVEFYPRKMGGLHLESTLSFNNTMGDISFLTNNFTNSESKNVQVSSGNTAVNSATQKVDGIQQKIRAAEWAKLEFDLALLQAHVNNDTKDGEEKIAKKKIIRDIILLNETVAIWINNNKIEEASTAIDKATQKSIDEKIDEIKLNDGIMGLMGLVDNIIDNEIKSYNIEKVERYSNNDLITFPSHMRMAWICKKSLSISLELFNKFPSIFSDNSAVQVDSTVTVRDDGVNIILKGCAGLYDNNLPPTPKIFADLSSWLDTEKSLLVKCPGKFNSRTSFQEMFERDTYSAYHKPLINSFSSALSFGRYITDRSTADVFDRIQYLKNQVELSNEYIDSLNNQLKTAESELSTIENSTIKSTQNRVLKFISTLANNIVKVIGEAYAAITDTRPYIYPNGEKIACFIEANNDGNCRSVKPLYEELNSKDSVGKYMAEANLISAKILDSFQGASRFPANADHLYSQLKKILPLAKEEQQHIIDKFNINNYGKNADYAMIEKNNYNKFKQSLLSSSLINNHQVINGYSKKKRKNKYIKDSRKDINNRQPTKNSRISKSRRGNRQNYIYDDQEEYDLMDATIHDEVTNSLFDIISFRYKKKRPTLKKFK